MARKSREAIWAQALEEVSRCPADLFSILTPDNEIIKLAEGAESGNLTALEELIGLVLIEGEASAGELPGCSALPYLCVIGCRYGSRLAAKTVIRGICEQCFDPLLFESAEGLLVDTEYSENADFKAARIAYIIEKIGLSGDTQEIKEFLPKLIKDTPEELYALSKLAQSDKKAQISATKCACELLVSPIPFFEKNNDPCEGADALKRIIGFLWLYRSLEWRDFWLKYCYEYAVSYLSSDLSEVAEDMAQIFLERESGEKKILHAYAVSALFGSDTARVSALRELCSFKGIEIPEDGELKELLKEAIYTSSRAEAEAFRKKEELGQPILHTKNRYTLSAELSSHIKRGKKHFWQIRLYFPKIDGGEKPPLFDKLTISEVRHDIERGGVRLTDARGRSQVILSSELTTGSVKHPFTIDFILDIAYVSATKCETGDLTVKSFRDLGEGYSLECNVLL